MTDDEPRYTLDEARREFARQECGYGGHTPSLEVRMVNENVAVEYYCDCDDYTWTPARRSA